MKDNPLQQIHSLGQSIWLDYISRSFIAGHLRRLIDEDGLAGMTSNPALFEKSIAESQDYDDDIRALAGEGKGPDAIFESLSLRDVQDAADQFRPLYERSGGRDGFVSLEVNPALAHDTRATLNDARRLWTGLDRPNVMVKVPATMNGLPAIRQLISEGVNVNVTLLFGLPRYRQVIEAYIAGIETRLAQGKPVKGIASVASFFLSRIDVMVDPLLDKVIAAGGDQAETARQARAQTAIACAKIAYQIYRETFSTPRFKKLAGQGAPVQRVLWASTGTKNPNYSDVKYVEPLIGPETINTLPLETLDAYRDHGDPRARLEDQIEQARSIVERLPELGIDLDQVTQQLEDDGVKKFSQPFDKLMKIIEERMPRLANVS